MKILFDTHKTLHFLLKYRNYLIVIFLFLRAAEYLLDTIKGDGDGSITSFYVYMPLTAIKLTLLLSYVSLLIIKYANTDFQALIYQFFDRLDIPAKSHYFLLLAVINISFSIYYNQGGFLEPESEYGAGENSTIGFIRHYLSDTSFWKKIFDVNITDNAAFQSRELSFIFDYIDCQFLDWCIGLGIPHFYSISHYIFITLIGWITYSFCIKVLRFPTFVTLALIVILWATPCIFFSVTFYRSAKISTAFFTLLYFVTIYKIFIAKPYKISVSKNALLFLIATAIVFTDRQGFFFMLLALLFFGAKWICFPQKTTVFLVVSCASAILLNTFYNSYLGGKLIFYFNGYYPDFTYQKIPWEMLTEWWSYQDLLFFMQATSLFLQEWGLLFGNLPIFMALVFAIIFISLFAKYETWKLYNGNLKQEINVKGIGGALFFLLIMAIIILNVLMIMRHPAINQPGYFRYYYPIPVTVLLFIFSILIINIILTHKIFKSIILYIIVSLIAMSNIVSLPEHYAVLKSDGAPRGRRIKETPVFLEGLRNINNPNYQVSDSLANRAIFKFFKDRHFKK